MILLLHPPAALLDRATALAMCTTPGERARSSGVPLPKPPAEPDSCCGRGCTGCVWESYYAAAAWWHQDALLRLQAHVQA